MADIPMIIIIARQRYSGVWILKQNKQSEADEHELEKCARRVGHVMRNPAKEVSYATDNLVKRVEQQTHAHVVLEQVSHARAQV